MNITADSAGRRIRITRSNQGQLVHRTAAILLTCCLILCLLPGSVAAQSSAASGMEDNAGIAIWGHSMPADVTPARLAMALRAVGAANPGRPIINQAIGGSGQFNSLLRQGAIAWTTEVTGGLIPAGGRIELTNHRSPVLEQQIGAQAAEVMAEVRWHRMANTWVEIYGSLRPQDPDPLTLLDAGHRRIITLVQASLDRMSAREKRLIILEGMPFTAPEASDKQGQSERLGVELARQIYQDHFPKYYFDYVSASLTGLGPVPPAREWFAKTYPDMFNDPATG